jgi:hypothetical protein
MGMQPHGEVFFERLILELVYAAENMYILPEVREASDRIHASHHVRVPQEASFLMQQSNRNRRR